MMKICMAETLKREEILNRQIHHQNLNVCYKLMNINIK